MGIFNFFLVFIYFLVIFLWWVFFVCLGRRRRVFTVTRISGVLCLLDPNLSTKIKSSLIARFMNLFASN